jgi:acyl-CoA thioester hydrolase
MERARCALLNELGYNYTAMSASGYAWPVVECKIKYIRPLRFLQEARITACLVEFENRLRFTYTIVDAKTGEICTKAETKQMAVDIRTGETLLESPEELLRKVRAYAAR